VLDDVVVNRGLRGDVNVDRIDADEEFVIRCAGCLRKTRAGGNWLMGGMLKEESM
jgi:hypothetical protein